MPVTVTHTNGRPTYDWEQLLFNVLQDGVFDTEVSANEIHLVLAGGFEVVFTGTGLAKDTGTTLAGGANVTGILIKDNGTDVVAWTGLNLNETTINGWFTAVDGLSGGAFDTYYSDGFKSAVVYPLIDSGASAVTGNGSGDADSIFGSNAADTLTGGSGNDYFQTRGASSGADTVTGGDDWNFLDLRPGAPVGGLTVNVTGGSDGEVRNASNTVIVNFTSIQGFALSDGDDTFNGGGNDEYIEAFDGSDTINGGGGWDKLSYRFETGQANGAGIGITVNVGLGFAIDTYGNTDFFDSIEGFKGSQYADTFNGDENDNQFEGMAGNDTFNGGAGADTVEYQWEYELGGAGGITVDLSTLDGNGYATVTDTFGDTDKLKNIENIIGTQENDHITGDDADNYFEGMSGDDTLNGGGGHDELRGQGGNDIIDGGDGDDRIRGGDGNNTLNGGDGRDNIRGGNGNDIINAGSGEFDFIGGTSGTDTVNGDSGFDMMGFDKDFEPEFAPEFASDGITVTLQAGANPGSGEITGFYGADTNGDPGAIVATTFENMEAIVGTWRADSFVATNTGFENTEDAQRSFFGFRGANGVFGFTGGDGIDTFDITNAKVIIDYDEEKWRQEGFDGSHEWGDLGELGVLINLSGSQVTRADFGFGPGMLDSGKGVDTFDNEDILNITGQIPSGSPWQMMCSWPALATPMPKACAATTSFMAA